MSKCFQAGATEIEKHDDPANLYSRSHAVRYCADIRPPVCFAASPPLEGGLTHQLPQAANDFPFPLISVPPEPSTLQYNIDGARHIF